MTIVDFLNARLDEDERATKSVPAGARGRARALAEVEAKRRIVRAYTEAYAESLRSVELTRAGVRTSDPWPALLAWRAAVKHLAVVYRSHPEYDTAWEE